LSQSPKVGLRASGQPWAVRHNPFGIGHLDFRRGSVPQPRARQVRWPKPTGSGEVAEDLGDGGSRGEAVEFAEGVLFAVLDELVRPADALDGGVDARGVEVVDDGRAETVEQDVVLEGAEHAAFAGVGFERRGVHRLDEARVDEGDGEAAGFVEGVSPDSQAFSNWRNSTDGG